MTSIVFQVRLAPGYVRFTPCVEFHVAVQNCHICFLSSVIFGKIKHFRPNVWLCRSRAGDKRQHVLQNSSLQRGHGNVLNFSNLGEQRFCRQGIFSKVWTVGCFSKDTLKKNKNPTPARNWGAPRKNISRRRGWFNKSRGLLKALEVWQKFTLWRNWRRNQRRRNFAYQGLLHVF